MAYDVEVKDLEERLVATVRVKTTPDRIGETFREVMPEVSAQLAAAAVQPPNPMFAIYHSYSQDEVDMELGLPLPGPIPTEGRVVGHELPATLAAVTWHHGSYDTIGEAFRAVEAWIEQEGKERAGPPFEVYWTGPEDDPDPAAWRTEVGYPIR
jgi:effector-binding domain-containing protein